MKKTTNWVLVAILTIGATVFTSCSNDDTPITPEQERQHTEAVSELIRLMDGNPDVKALLEKSIARAAAVNPDRKYNPAPAGALTMTSSPDGWHRPTCVPSPTRR